MKLLWCNIISPGKPLKQFAYVGSIRIEKQQGKVCIGNMETSLIKFDNEKTLLKFLTI